MDDDSLARGDTSLSVATDRPDDVARLLALLKEYTDKCRDLHERRQSSGLFLKKKPFILIGLLIAIIMFAAGYHAGKQDPLNIETSTLALLGASLIVLAIAAFEFITETKSIQRQEQPYALHEMTAGLERLVKMASQTLEHGRLSFADRIELELRLAEAEVALQHYHAETGKALDLKSKGG